MSLDVHRGDITRERVDAIVNAANHTLLGGGGVDGAIHRAGGRAVTDACRELRRTTLPDGLPTGEAVATTAGALPARWVIHTVGPVYAASKDHSALLHGCYVNSVRVARELGAASVAFPLVSAGVYGWPAQDALRIAITELRHADGVDTRLVLFSDELTSLAEPILAEANA